MPHRSQNVHLLGTILVTHSKLGIVYMGPLDHPVMNPLKLYSKYVYWCIFLGEASICISKFRKGFISLQNVKIVFFKCQ